MTCHPRIFLRPLFVIGSILTVARASMPSSVATTFEFLVAIMVVAIGAKAVRDGWRLGRTGPVSTHTHGGHLHAHETSGLHVHLGPFTLAKQPMGWPRARSRRQRRVDRAGDCHAADDVESDSVHFVVRPGLDRRHRGGRGSCGLPLARLVQRQGVAAALSIATGTGAIVYGVSYGRPLLMALLTR